MTKVKIFVSYKDKHKILQNNIVTPIQTGRAIADETFNEMLGDNTGDNISNKNPRFCELTAQYWVWKNLEKVENPEYIGFMHYRRQFIFDKNLPHLNSVWLPDSSFYFLDSIPDDYMLHFSEDKILPHLENADCIVFKKVNIRPVSHQNDMKHHFYLGMPSQKEEVFNTFENVIKTDYPQYYETFLEFKNGTRMYCCNSFVMKKELFIEYSEFLFGVLTKVDAQIDSSQFNSAEQRFLGFLGEFLLSIFVMQKLKNPTFTLKELDGTYVSNEYKKYEKKCIKYTILASLTFGKKKRYYLKKLSYYKKCRNK